MNRQQAEGAATDDVSRKLRVVRWLQQMYGKTDGYGQLADVFMIILRSLDDVLGFKHSMIYLLNDDGRTLAFQSCWGYAEGHAGAPVQVGQGFIGMAAQTGEVMRFVDLGKGFRYMNAIRSRQDSPLSESRSRASGGVPGMMRPESLMSVPLRAGTGVLGVIVVESDRPGAFDEVDQELLLLIAGQTAQLIEEARRAENGKRRREGLQHAESHLRQLNLYLDTVVSAVSMENTRTYTAAMANQTRGMACMSSETGKAIGYFEQAADVFYEIGLLLETVKSKLGVAVLVYPDYPERAYSLLQECLKGFAACGAASYVELTRSLMESLEPADPALRQLTKREREIAALCSQGLSNPEIAERLVLSVRTVTTHVERIYSKLDVRSRAELSRYIRQHT